MYYEMYGAYLSSLLRDSLCGKMLQLAINVLCFVEEE